MEPGQAGSATGQSPPSLTPRRLLLWVVLSLSGLAGIYLIAGSLEGFSRALRRLQNGDPAWLVAGALFELLSLVGYAILFRAVAARDVALINWRAALQIPLAGIAALRLLATGGAGGFAVTAWALREAGLSGRAIGRRMVAVLVVQYAFYLLALVVFGFGLWGGLFPGDGSFALTVLPAALAAAVILLFGLLALLPAPPDRTAPPRRLRRLLLEARHAVHGGLRAALEALGLRGEGWERLQAVVGALCYWAFDTAVLWCGFRAFGAPPALAVVVMTYFLGTLGGLLPFAAGVGGIEGGMLGVAVAFGVPLARALVAVLAYRLISFWLPTVPGIAGYLGLRRTVRRWRQGEA